MANANTTTLASAHDDLLRIMHAAQACECEELNDQTREFFLNEIVATAAKLIDQAK